MPVTNDPDSLLTNTSGRYSVRRARIHDLIQIVALLTDDILGQGRESAEPEGYRTAFAEIAADPNQFLAVVEGADGSLVATMQLTLIPGLSRGGTKRLQVEGVRVAGSERDSGLGTALFQWAEGYARSRGATLLQLTTDKQRPDAHRFYEQLGYVATHEGYKRALPY